MAIKKFDNKASISPSDFEGLFIGLNNGDLEGLKEAVKKWNLKDEESLIKFAIAILLKADDDKLFIVDSDNNKISILPSDDLLKKPDNQQ